MSKLFLRHGEVKNKKDIFYGDLVGYQLSDKGHEQAIKASRYIANNFDIQNIYCSPLLRARQTAEPLSRLLNIKVTYTKNLIEWGGVKNWKGRTFSEFSKSKEYKLYIEDPLKIKTTEETYNDVYKRVKKEYMNTNNSVFVSHQDTIRSFTFYELDDKNFNENKPDHCSVHEIIKNKLIIHTYLD